MADCFSLPNAAELIGELRAWSGCIIYGDNCDECDKEEGQERRFCRQQQETMFIAADAIEALLVENKRLKAELDSAMKELPHDCNTCSKDCDITIAHKALSTKRCDEWEWRGVQKEEEDATD